MQNRNTEQRLNDAQDDNAFAVVEMHSGVLDFIIWSDFKVLGKFLPFINKRVYHHTQISCVSNNGEFNII